MGYLLEDPSATKRESLHKGELRASLKKYEHDPIPRTFQCEVRLMSEESGGFSVYAVQLPGIWSQGEDEGEALRMIAEALQGALGVYCEEGGEIPWQEPPEPREGEMRRWLVVHV